MTFKFWHSRISSKYQTTRFLFILYSHYIFNIFSIFVISNIQYNINRNRVSDDANHVNDFFIVIKISKKFLFKFWSMSKFTSFRIKNDLKHDLDILFQRVSRTSYDIFSLFFTFEIFQYLIDCTNQYETNLHVDKKKQIVRSYLIFYYCKKVTSLHCYLNIYEFTFWKLYWEILKHEMNEIYSFICFKTYFLETLTTNQSFFSLNFIQYNTSKRISENESF